MKTQKPISFEIISLNNEGYHLKISAKVNGLEISLIIDSGASQTAFDLSFVRDVLMHDEIISSAQVSSGLGTNTMQSYVAKFDEFQLENLIIQNYKAAILDLSHVNETYQKLNIEPIQGILGNDILLNYEAYIDYKNKQLWFGKTV